MHQKRASPLASDFSQNRVSEESPQRESVFLSVTIRAQKLNTTFVSQTFRAPKNPGISRQKVWFSWVSRDIPNFLAPTPSRGRSTPHRKISEPKSLGLGSLIDRRENGRSLAILIATRSHIFRVHAKWVTLCERACFCLLSTFYDTTPSKNPSKNSCLC